MAANKKINRTSTTQLSEPIEYDVNDMIFDEPLENTIPGSTLKFHRINIGTKNPPKNGKQTEGDLIFRLHKCSSYGIAETRDMQTNQLNGYQVSLVLTDKDNPTDEQRQVIETLNKVVEKCKDHLLSVKGKIKKGTLDRGDLKKMDPSSFFHILHAINAFKS